MVEQATKEEATLSDAHGG